MDVRHEPVDPQTQQRVTEVIHGVFQQANGRLGDMVCADSERVIGQNLAAFIEIIRNTHCDSIEPYLIQFLEDICSHCPYQYPTLHCSRRYLKACGLFECASALVSGVRSALNQSTAASLSRAGQEAHPVAPLSRAGQPNSGERGYRPPG